MAVTQEQLEIINNFINSIADNGHYYSYADIRSALNEDCTSISSQVLGKIIKNLATSKGYVVNSKKNRCMTISVCKVQEVTNVVKNKSVVSFLDKNNEIIVSFDYCGEKVFPNSNLVFAKNLSFISLFLPYIGAFTQIPEYVWSYMDLFQDLYEKRLLRSSDIDYILTYLKQVPKGYINFIQEYNVGITNRTFLAFKVFNNGYPAQFVKRIMDERKYSFMPISFLSEISYNDYLKVQKVIINSIKDNSYFNNTDIDSLHYEIRNYSIELLDTNRGVRENLAIYENYCKFKANEDLGKALRKLNFLNGFTIGDYIVVVPQDIIQLQEEGKQQHNCVGSYYNGSILQHENLIYFLRKKENPCKSIVTCRYNIESKKTVEHRTKNNQKTTLEQERIIAEIDKIINKNLV